MIVAFVVEVMFFLAVYLYVSWAGLLLFWLLTN